MKKALLFGINDYPGSQNDLQGCVNDVNDIAEILKSFGFEKIDIFINEQVTCAKFEFEILKMFRESTLDDKLFIGYSGHGTQVADLDGDEEDGYDEAIYLFDNAYTDDKVRRTLLQKKVGIPLLINMDCCFSGTNTRALDIRYRFKPIMPKDMLDESGNIKNRKRRKSIIKNPDLDYVVISGCMDGQTSADAYFSGRYNGAETFFLFKKSLRDGISTEDWYKKLRTYLPSNNFSQAPNMEGDKEYMKMGALWCELKKKECFLKRWFGKKLVADKPIIPPTPPKPPTQPPPPPPEEE